MGNKISLFVKSSEFFKERVEEVLSKSKFSTTETAEFYLVDLLDRYITTNNLTQDPLAIQFLRAQESGMAEGEKIKILKKLGDTSLYVSGFFSDSLSRKVVDLDYYRQMGSIAYKCLSHTIKEESFHDLYEELHAKFSAFAEILHEISHDLLPQTDQSLLRLYEVYLKTGSEAAKKYLLEQGFKAKIHKN